MNRILPAIFAALAALVGTGCMTTENESGGRRVDFVCEGGEGFTVGFTDGAATLEAAGGSYRLTQQPTGSGIRYTGDGHELRGRGQDMVWTDASGRRHQCREAGGGPPVMASPLAGTSWRLVRYEASDDAFQVPP